MNSAEDMKALTVQAVDENLDRVQGMVEEMLEGAGAQIKVIYTVAIAIEEMFVNVCHYAYEGKTGDVKVEAGIFDCEDNGDGATHGVRTRLTDSGMPYDPLAKEDPDITLSAEERSIGGLGIYMVKKSMDSVDYEYSDGHNIFTMEKRF